MKLEVLIGIGRRWKHVKLFSDSSTLLRLKIFGMKIGYEDKWEFLHIVDGKPYSNFAEIILLWNLQKKVLKISVFWNSYIDF